MLHKLVADFSLLLSDGYTYCGFVLNFVLCNDGNNIIIKVKIYKEYYATVVKYRRCSVIVYNSVLSIRRVK